MKCVSLFYSHSSRELFALVENYTAHAYLVQVIQVPYLGPLSSRPFQAATAVAALVAAVAAQQGHC